MIISFLAKILRAVCGFIWSSRAPISSGLGLLLINVGFIWTALWQVNAKGSNPELVKDLILSGPGLTFIIGILLALTGDTLGFLEKRAVEKEALVAKATAEDYRVKLEGAMVYVYSQMTGIEETLGKIMRSKAQAIFGNLNFGSTERVSVYNHDGERFRLVGRYAQNKQFDTHNRESIPDDKGFIGKAWQEGVVVYCEKLPRLGTAKYQKRLGNAYRLSPETIGNLRMPSRAYFVQLIKDPGGERIGVVVLESAKGTGLERVESSVLLDSENQFLTVVVEGMDLFKVEYGRVSKKEVPTWEN